MTTEATPAAAQQLKLAEEELVRWREKVSQLRRQLPPQQIHDYQLKDESGKVVTLSSLFGNKEDLIVIHNMGKKCVYCTLWADGFNGVYEHLENRAGFAVVSPDEPPVMRDFAVGRNWKFRILSNAGGAFTREMGFESPKGDPHPGISTFHRGVDGVIQRISHAPFGEGDDFCVVWHMIDMLKDGRKGWEPKYSYP
ncbi:MAG TPA: DUF899 family protein [Candidatus Deferrimicrobium sp.]|nr:DUF899 family protein [Candidatus Deferrimicrobium sp.]